MQLIERHDQWARAHMQALLHHKKITIPAEYYMPRPGEEEQEVRRVETDPVKIAAFFRDHLSG